MKKVFISLIVIVIILLSFLIPEVLLEIEDLNMGSKVYKKEEPDNKLDVQAENIYLVRAIHDIEDRDI